MCSCDVSSEKSVRLLMCAAHGVEQPDERGAIFLPQSLQALFERVVAEGVDFLQHRRALRRNPAEMLAAILRTALPPDELLRLEAIEQPRDAGRRLDHAIRDLERRQPVVARAAQNPEDVELLQRDAVR